MNVRHKVSILTVICLAVLVMMACAGRETALAAKYQRTIESVTLPDVTLVNQDGANVRLRNIVNQNKPVVVNFIFTTCTTICPVLSAGFADLQQKLGNDSNKIELVSITLDPDNDTPDVAKKYLKRFNAKPGWNFLTGSRTDIEQVTRAFSAYVSNKMSHAPLTLIYSPRDGKWIRIYGHIGSSDFLKECREAGLK